MPYKHKTKEEKIAEIKRKKAEYFQKYYLKNKQRLKQYAKEYNKINQSSKEYYHKNQDKIKEYRANNKLKIKKRDQKYQKLNKTKLTEYRKKYYENIKEKRKRYCNKNKLKISEQTKKYRANNKLKIQAYYKQHLQKPEVKNRIKKYIKKYRANNKLKIRQQRKKYETKRYEQDRKYRILVLLRNRFYRAITTYTKTGKVDSSKNYGIDYQKIVEFLSPLPTNLQDYHIHHIKPLCSFNFINPDESINQEQIKQAFAPANHKLLLIQEHMNLNHKELMKDNL